MSAQNPFQIPTCFKLDIEQRRRERFKKAVVTAVIVSVAVVIGLLIEGCVSEKSEATDEQIQANATIQTPAQPTATALPPSVEHPVSPLSLPVQPCPVATVPKQTATPADPPHITGAAVYLVKSGDTLSRIAHAHHTTVKAIKDANRLDSDRISIGQKLSIPTA
ncbi:MAG TPA: LysM peptidoglycan-binding domain-containing protein [Verrucomicrobiae bacterium]|nr:LysM peptidoglycan-binding domain-containing protein [Verrucomicrobiae bacterium]